MRVTLTRTTWIGPDGRKWLRGVPEGAPASDAAIGIPLGPPDLSDLGLPDEIHVRLHNALYDRHVFSYQDARKDPREINSALIAAFRVSVQRILQLYEGEVEDAETADT